MTEMGHDPTFATPLRHVWKAAKPDIQARTAVRFGHAAISTALANSLTRITGPYRIRRQWEKERGRRSVRAKVPMYVIHGAKRNG